MSRVTRIQFRAASIITVISRKILDDEGGILFDVQYLPSPVQCYTVPPVIVGYGGSRSPTPTPATAPGGDHHIVFTIYKLLPVARLLDYHGMYSLPTSAYFLHHLCRSPQTLWFLFLKTWPRNYACLLLILHIIFLLS